MKTIAALVDFSDLTFKVLKQAHALALAFKGQVFILHLVPEPVVADLGAAAAEAANQKKRAEEHSRLLEIRDTLANNGVQATLQELTGLGVQEILDEVKKLGADLIIVGSHRHGRLFHLLLGTITDSVLAHAHCPVLVVPADDPAPTKK